MASPIDRENLRDSFAEDMANAQRRQGKLPTIRENQELCQPIFERVEREFSRYTPTGKVTRQNKAAQKAADKGYQMLRESDLDGMVQRVAPVTGKQWHYYQRLSARVALLSASKERGPAGQPSWSERVQAALYTFARNRKIGTKMLVEVCNASSEKFGNWLVEPARRLYG